MKVARLMLEITRNCNFVCEQCCRDDKQVINMSFTTMDNVFKDIEEVDVLFLTGGEVFVAINELEHLCELIESGKVKVHTVSLITNATVLGSRTLNVLKRLAIHAELDIRISYDIFHQLEAERLGLLEKRDENISILCELFGVKVHTNMESPDTKSNLRGLHLRGRAKNITKERLAEINAMLPFDYVISNNFFRQNHEHSINDNCINGTVYVDVNGYLVSLSLEEYEAEDREAKESNIDLNKMDILNAIAAFDDYQLKKYREKMRALFRQ